MFSHLRSNLLLLGLTVGICCVAYPLVLFAVGQTMFHDRAEGSLVYDKSGNAIGSSLIAQPFSSDEYFHPRPSAVSYNAAASGGSNWGANNPNLRKRVVGMLGPMLKYRDGRAVGPDIVAWVRESLTKQRALLVQWTAADPDLAERWGSANADFLTSWEQGHAAEIAEWKRTNTGAEPTPKIVADLFFADFVKNSTTQWPDSDGAAIQVAFFESWWRAHPTANVEPVPADLVMASGSGLDPHITLKAALYQLDRVAAKRASAVNRDAADIKHEIEKLIRERAEAPLGGVVGVEMVNVLELNVALNDRYGA